MPVTGSKALFFAAVLAIAAAVPFPPAAAAPQASAPAQAKPIFVFGLQHNTSARLTFMADSQPDLSIRQVPGGVEVRSKGPAAYQLVNMPALREIAGIDLRMDGDEHVAFIRLTGQCNVHEERLDNKVRLDLIETGPLSVPPAAVQTAANPAAAQPAPKPPAKAASDLEGLRAGLTEKLALLKAVAPPAAKAPAAGNPVQASSQTPTPQLDAPQPIVPQQFLPPTMLAGGSGTSASPAAAVRLSCPPVFTMDGWKGEGPFAKVLEALRQKAADANESPAALAALAEFYLGNGLGGEALAVTREVRLEGVSAADRMRVERDRDLARLFKGEAIPSTSILLANEGNCNRTDVPLWRALSAAASNDAQVLRQDAEAASQVLQTLPEPLGGLLALRIAEADTEDLPVLRAMAGANRNAETGSAVDMAGRFLLQARVAHARKDPVDEANFLERATHGIGLTGLKAKVLLAELRSTQDDEQGTKSESLLADAARVYRDTPLGEGASAALSEQRLRHSDYLGALRAANITAAGKEAQRVDSHGADLAARVLRGLLADKTASNLPPASERLLIYWRYGGYATPGEKGDDIRLGAADLMLDQGLPEPALDTLRQLSAAVSPTPRAVLLRATAEARAGDANKALDLLKTVPADETTRRVTADALARLGKPIEAAQQLGASSDPSDKLRRASLFYAAKQWPDAADAYVEVLRDPKLAEEVRAETANHYAVAVALAGKTPAEGLGQLAGVAKHLIGALPRQQAGADQPPVSAVRGSLQRAGEIEALLPPAPPQSQSNGS